MDRVNLKFIEDNKSLIIKHCFINALRLQKEAELLMSKNFFSRANFLIITAFEEIAKALLIINGKSKTKNFQNLIYHKFKIPKIVEIINNCSNNQLNENNKGKLKVRILNMREDCLYTRLKPTLNNQFMPDDKYWRKRAIFFYGYFQKYLYKVSKFLE